jgi:hypothetical protein
MLTWLVPLAEVPKCVINPCELIGLSAFLLSLSWVCSSKVKTVF